MKRAWTPLVTFYLLFTCCSISANPFTWTGAGGNGNWSNEANWDTAPDFSADNNTQNGYIFLFNTATQTVQTVVSGTRRFARMEFTAGSFELNNGTSTFTFGSASGGIVVTTGDHVLNAGRYNFNIFTDGSSGGLTVNNGSLTLNVNEGGTGFSITGSSTIRWLPVSGNGTITLNGAMLSASNGGSVRLKEDFSGRLIMNTAGSQLGIGDVEHRGTGTLVVGANDALGFLTLRFENAAAKIESGNGARTIANAVIADTGFTLTGQNSMTFSGTVNLGNTGKTISVDHDDGVLMMSDVVSGSSGEIVKSGGGTWILSGDNTAGWSQSIRVNQGMLLVANESGSATGTGDVWVDEQGILAGYGRIQGDVYVEGTLGIGGESSPLTFGSTLYMEENSIIRLTHEAMAGVIEGDLVFGENVQLLLEDLELWEIGETYRLFNLMDGDIVGTLALGGGLLGDFSYQSGPNGYVEFTLTAVPEPATWVLLVGAMLLVTSVIRRKHQ